MRERERERERERVVARERRERERESTAKAASEKERERKHAPKSPESPKMEELASVKAAEKVTPPKSTPPTQEPIDFGPPEMPPSGGKGTQGCTCKPSLLDKILCALAELDLDPHANQTDFKMKHRGTEWEWTKKRIGDGTRVTVKVMPEPPNLPKPDSRDAMKNLQDGGFGGDLITNSVKDDNSEKQLKDQKAEVGNDGDTHTHTHTHTLPPGVTLKKGKCSIIDKLVDAAKCFAAKVSAPVCASCSQSCSCSSVLNDAGSSGNDLFDELKHMGKKVGKKLEEEKVDEKSHQHMHQLLHEGEQKINAINKGLKHADADEKLEAAEQKAEIMAEQQVQLVKDQVKMEEAQIGSRIEDLEKKIAKHGSLGKGSSPELEQMVQGEKAILSSLKGDEGKAVKDEKGANSLTWWQRLLRF